MAKLDAEALSKHDRPMKAKKQPWDRQPNEPPRAFRAFVYYLEGDGELFMPTRSLAEVAKKAKASLKRLYPIAQEWEWSARADAKDQWDLDQRRVAQRRELFKMHNRHAKAATAAMGAALSTLQKYVPSGDRKPAAMTPAEAIRCLEVAVKIERMARGEPDTIQKTQGEVTVNNSPAQDDERLALRKILEDPKGVEHMAAISRLLGQDGSPAKGNGAGNGHDAEGPETIN